MEQQQKALFDEIKTQVLAELRAEYHVVKKRKYTTSGYGLAERKTEVISHMEKVSDALCVYFDIDKKDLFSKKRSKSSNCKYDYSLLRYMVMSISRATCKIYLTRTDAGEYFNRDHSTATYAEGVVDSMMYWKSFKKDYNEILKKVRL